MRKVILPIMLLLPAILFAQPGNYTIKGKIGKIGAPAKIYLSYRSGTNTFKDSSAVVKGVFEFKGTIADPIKANLVLNYMGSGMRGGSVASMNGKTVQSLPFYLEAADMKISSADSLSHAKIKGSKLNEDNEKLNLALKPGEQKNAALMAEYSALSPAQKKDTSIMAGIIKRSNAINEEQNQVHLKFLKANPNTLVSLDALKRFGGSIPDYSVVNPLFEGFSATLKNTTAGREYAAQLEKMKAVSIGAPAPEFSQNDPDGKPVKLSDFKGKYLLVDFWASWCGPCRAENPNVVKAYAKYHPKGFEILGVSLDNEKGKEAWLKAIEKDGLTWSHVSDLKYWNNEVAVLYGVRAIPQNFLIDPAGKIVGKNLRGEALASKLAEIFN